MKNFILLLMLVCTFSLADASGKSIYTVLEDSTSSGVTEGSLLLEEERPAGFIIKHVTEEARKVSSADNDNDGVLNENDSCEDTPVGKIVNKDGCTKLIRLNVRFDFDKYDVKDEYKDEIQEALEFLNENQELTASVEGHTDWVGTLQYNQILSELRATTVAGVLADEGIDIRRIKVKGFGETDPVSSNNTEEGRSKNRRVDISFNR